MKRALDLVYEVARTSNRFVNILILEPEYLNFGNLKQKLVYLFKSVSKQIFHQDTLFVLRIGKGGVADRNGLLRRGDEIVEINGQNMKEVNPIPTDLDTRLLQSSIPDSNFQLLKVSFKLTV